MNYLPDVFRIVSWNMQGACGIDKTTGKIKDKLSLLQEYMQDEQVIAICLQECSDLYGWWQGYKELAEFLSKEKMERKIIKRTAKHEKLLAQFKDIGKTEESLKLDEKWADPIMFVRGRCSLGILVRKHYFADQKVNVIDFRRPIMGIRLHGFNRKQPLYLFSIHVPYEDRDPTYIKDILDYASSNGLLRADGNEGNWICAGDFNHHADDPIKLFESFVPNMRRPGVLTTVKNEYDYCFVGGETLSSRGCSVHVHPCEYSDHHPVHFLFSPWPVISRHASNLAANLPPKSEKYKTRPVWQLYNKLYPQGNLIRS
jgi:endonuclease/exonuclease/phosphatase family metal-dependent hydrolase